jgi:glutathione S-transferase
MNTKLPALELTDGTVLTHSRAIFDWIAQQHESNHPKVTH